MQVYRDLCAAPGGSRYSVVIGNFDGLHIGHRAIFDEARRREGALAVITFDPHPRAVLQPGYAPRMLTSFEERLAFFDALGVASVFALPFEPLRSLAPVEFLDLLHRSIPLAAVTVGFNFNFGRGQEGNTDILLWWSKGSGVAAHIVPPVVHRGTRVSSSAVREFIMNGEMERAAERLVFPYVMTGTVRRGRQVGAQLGFPTLNLPVPDKLLPPDGVYATALVMNGARYGAVTNIGTNPTMDAETGERTIETHVPGVTLPERYDERVAVYFLSRIRREIRFSSREKLREKITQDIAIAQERLAGIDLKGLPELTS
ncbi:MAG TPA: bifunctional riboflavin kinase/FAD synthetase [bacterium]|nr:bifunctional riboflavin kinase/FAD synthetase [bacterium]